MGDQKDTVSQPHRSLFSVIPARVRDDRTLRPNGKLLYGELSALAQSEGYCWASNAYLANILDLSAKTIEALLRQLDKSGHIRREVEADPVTHAVVSRKIWICGPPGVSVPPPLKNEGGSPQNKGEPPLKNEGENNINIINTPYSPPEGDCVSKSSRKKKARAEEVVPEWKPERFHGFWRYYARVGRGESRLRAIRAWDRLKPDDKLIDTMAVALSKQAQTRAWKEGIGVPYASTWLNNRRWEDELRPDDDSQHADSGGGWAEDEEVMG